jgi:hypothetical protein
VAHHFSATTSCSRRRPVTVRRRNRREELGMRNLSRPRTAAEREARRNYLIFCTACTLGLAGAVGAVSLYLTAT